jgi:hypothetical protein
MTDREEKIRERAHQIWLDEGQPRGQEQAHWYRAAREIDKESSEAPTVRMPLTPREAG